MVFPAQPPPPRELPRRDTSTVLRAIETVDEQPAQMPMDSSSHFETAVITVKSIVAGGLAGMVAKSVVTPVDRIKILFQVSSEEFCLRKVLQILARIYHDEGFSGLWKGNSATMLRVFPYAGIQFMTFDAVKANLLKLKEGGTHGGQLTNIESLFAGSFAGFVSCSFTYPLDFARARLAVEGVQGAHYLRPSVPVVVGGTAGAAVAGASSTGGGAVRGGGGRGGEKGGKGAGGKGKGAINHNVFDIFRAAYREGGILSLYRGITPTLLGILPYAGIAFTINDKANHQIHRLTGHEPTTLQKLGCGAFAGLAAQSATYPLDVVRRRMQTAGVMSGGGGCGDKGGDGGKGGVKDGKAHNVRPPLRPTASPGHDPHTASMRQVLMEVYKQEGMKGLFKGLSMNWIKGPVALGISFTTFDFLKRYLNVQQPEKKMPI